MSASTKVALATILFALAGGAANVLAEDWHAREAEILGLRDLCNKGDRKACVRFGEFLGEAKERHAEWRKTHPDWWWWE